MRCLNFLQQVISNGYILKTLIQINTAATGSKGFVLEVDPEYPKELCELHNDYPLAPDKIEIKKETLSKYQLRLLIFIIFLLVLLKN